MIGDNNMTKEQYRLNCFTYVYKTLKREGYCLPVSFGGYTMKKPEDILLDYQHILDEKIHYAYFESFCDYVSKAEPNDIILHKQGVGIAVNDMMYVSILYNPLRRVIQKIRKGHKVLRIRREGIE